MIQKTSCILLIMFSILGYGQVAVLSETDTKNYYLKEPFNLSIGLQVVGENYHQQSPLKLPDLSKFEILGNANESIQTINPETGEMVRQVVHHFILLPRQSGKIRIGSTSVKINGKTYKSEAFDIWVKDGKKAEELGEGNVQLVMEASKREVYENQPINVVLRLKAEEHQYDDFRKISQLKLPKYGNNIHVVNLEKQDIEIGHDDVASQVVASFVVFPDREGVLTITPAMAHLNEHKISSNPLKINVKKLPLGAPQTFKNAVGAFSVEMKVLADEVELHKPFDVFVKLKGSGNLNNIELPKIKASGDYTLFKPKQKTNYTPNDKGFLGEIVEHYVLVPKKEGKINIGLEEFVYFDLEKNTYKNIEKKNIHVMALNEDDYETKEDTLFQETNVEENVDNQQKNEEKKSEKMEWKPILWAASLGLGILGLFLFCRKKIRKPKSVKSLNEEETMSIVETENALRNELLIGVNDYLEMLKNSAEKGDGQSFFAVYDELHAAIEKQLKNTKNESIEEILENRKGQVFLQEYQVLREKMGIEKYAPVHDNLYMYYTEIHRIYKEILE